MISAKGDNFADWDPTSTTVIDIDNQVAGRRHKMFVMLPRHEMRCRLMAQFCFIHPVTGKLEWTNFDPLRKAPIDICVQFNIASGAIIVRIYANAGLKKARRWLAELVKEVLP